MQSSAQRGDNSYISLGVRRGISDLARFSLDLSWARATSDSAQARAYPSPPMSRSPPLPPRPNLDGSDRHNGSFESSGRDVYRYTVMSQVESAERGRKPALRPYQDSLPPTSYSAYRMEDNPQQIQYHQQRAQPQIQHIPPYLPQALPPYSASNSSSVAEPSEYSPKAQRKTKGHVASACVPCKRAHLRCDEKFLKLEARRPCSRCLSNGKEDTCVDVQHKKRGRPRLRDERDSRYETTGPVYPPQPLDVSMRHSQSLFTTSEASTHGTFGESIQQSSSSRVLKSQGGPYTSPHYTEHQTPGNFGLYGSSIPITPRMIGVIGKQESVCAFLTMDMRIVKATRDFGEAVGNLTAGARKLHDLVSASDRDKIFRLQRMFEDERREREPNYLPPIYSKAEEDRIIQTVGIGPQEMEQIRPDRQELMTFQGPDGQQRVFQVRFGLAKRDSTYFIAISLDESSRPPAFYQPSSAPYSRDSYPRETPYGYQSTQQTLVQPGALSFTPQSAFNDSREEGLRNAEALRSKFPPSTSIAPFSQPSAGSDYSQAQIAHQMARGETQRQLELQLPPIRDQRGDDAMMGARRRDVQAGRLDIGGLPKNHGMGN